MDMPLTFGNYLLRVISKEVTQEGRAATRWLTWSKHVGVFGRQIRRTVIPEMRSDPGNRNKVPDPMLPRKPSL